MEAATVKGSGLTDDTFSGVLSAPARHWRHRVKPL